MSESSDRFSSRYNPLSAILGILLIPVMLIVGPLSTPFGAIRRRIADRKKQRFESEMKAAGRLIPWSDACSRVANGNGTLIWERLSFKDSRLWWTSDDLAAISPYPCYFDEGPAPWDHQPSFDWCRSHFTNPEGGTGLLVNRNVKDSDRESARQALKDFRTAHRCVSI